MYENHIWELRIKKWIRKRSSSEYYLSSKISGHTWFESMNFGSTTFIFVLSSLRFLRSKHRSATHLRMNLKIIEIITIKNEVFLRFLSLRIYQLHCLRYDNKSIVSFNFVIEIPILPHFLKISFLSNNWPKRQLINESVSLRNSSW